ncbi:D-alanyl-D-alanine carboxypeptidase precursor [Corynebacterium ciconiae DSM 44920]|uniref:serine hydrolase domain-containing protein n=1 Tax=Corynebacterium ciconiae TaxID=227319 RepID=UPI0003636AAA|nr:serine hydrolase domain-containing protein [Corynebacterium ciconiae]WKD61286.1 D-alanyl-D-alanine carboxypeptidase precursor [Corynebacterium ciconiae DSM 44920]
MDSSIPTTAPVPTPETLAERAAAIIARSKEETGATHTGWALINGRDIPAADNADDIFRVASITKSFTACAMLGIIHGLIPAANPVTLETTVGQFIPIADSSINATTIRQLLSMASGLPTDDVWADRVESMSREEFTTLVTSPLMLTAAPGSTYIYSNLGYALIGRAIEYATGRSFTEIVEQHILRPSGLEHSLFDATSHIPVTGLHRLRPNEMIEVTPTGPGAFSPIGGLCTTMNDLACWVQRMIAAWNDPTTGWSAVLNEQQQTVNLEKATTIKGRAVADAYGYGLHVREDEKYGQVVFHSGGYPGFGSHMLWHPATELGVVLAGNITYYPAQKYAEEILYSWLDEIDYQRGRKPFKGVRPVVDSFSVSEHARATARKVERLIHSWDDSLADELFALNMDLDTERSARREMLQQACLRGCESIPLKDLRWINPTEAHWTLSADPNTVLRMLLGPTGEVLSLNLQQAGSPGSVH